MFELLAMLCEVPAVSNLELQPDDDGQGWPKPPR